MRGCCKLELITTTLMKMPSNWNNAKGWERYYASLYPGSDDEEYGGIGSIPLRELPNFVEGLLQKGWTTAWVPGCGLSALPKFLSQLGMDVHATDISPTAIAYQQSDDDVSLPDSTAKARGALTCVVHDFRQPYLDDHFDLIINVKAIQGFPPETIRQVARVHYLALKPGRRAYFDTMNVQGERREMLEAALVEAGFFLPFHALNVWYRERLRETNIPHIFILGRPMIPKEGIYASDEEKWQSDTTIIRAIAVEYEQKAVQEQEAERQRITELDRIATVIYSTG